MKASVWSLARHLILVTGFVSLPWFLWPLSTDSSKEAMVPSGYDYKVKNVIASVQSWTGQSASMILGKSLNLPALQFPFT